MRWILAELSGFEWIRESDLSDDVAGLEHLSISPQHCGRSSHVVMTAPLVISTLLSKKDKMQEIVFTDCEELFLRTVEKSC